MNVRDIASINELAVLSNLESLNAELIKYQQTKKIRKIKRGQYLSTYNSKRERFYQGVEKTKQQNFHR